MAAVYGLFSRDSGDARLPFADRTDAGRRLARRLDFLEGQDVVVVALPRGGLPVAAEVARALAAPLDVIVVRKLGVPFQPELAMGAIGEDGARVLDERLMREVGVDADDLALVEQRERAELARRTALFRAVRRRVSLKDKIVVVVDDGLATGSTARAACHVARAEGAARIVLAVPVAPSGWDRRMAGTADDFVCVATPRHLTGISAAYASFPQLTDEQALTYLAAEEAAAAATTAAGPRPRDADVDVSTDRLSLPGRLSVPENARGVVVFAHGSGSSRHSPRNREVAQFLNAAGLATLLFDLLTPEEAGDRSNVFDIDRLAARLVGARSWLTDETDLVDLPVGLFGASTGAAAALVAAAQVPDLVSAVVSRGGRPDLAGDRLPLVRAATLLIVGSLDEVVLQLNRQALVRLRCPAQLAVIPGATHLFEEPGTLKGAAEAARSWFLSHLAGQQAAGDQGISR